MIRVFYFSGTGHCSAVAAHTAAELNAVTEEIRMDTPFVCCGLAVVVFPVYGDSIPPPVERFLSLLAADRVALAAVYGGISHGNVLSRAAKLAGSPVTAAVYITAGHSYLCEPAEYDRAAVERFLDGIAAGESVELPREKPSLPGRAFPEQRGRMLVRLRRSRSCTGCGECSRVCPMGTMKAGVPGRDCLRCLRCVHQCPEGALTVCYSAVIRAYLRMKKGKGVRFYTGKENKDVY